MRLMPLIARISGEELGFDYLVHVFSILFLLGGLLTCQQVTNQAPRKPSTSPINGLERANQSGIASLKGSGSRVGLRKRVTVIAKGIGLPVAKDFTFPATSKE